VDSRRDTATEAERERYYRGIRRSTSGIETLRPGAIETATFLLTETKASFDRAAGGATNTESKATVFLSIVASAASALGLFGAHGDRTHVMTRNLAIATTLIVAALVSILWTLRAKWFPSPNLNAYVSAAMVAEDNRIGLSLALAEYYGEMRVRLETRNRRDARVLFVAYAATAAAALTLLLDVAGLSRETSSPKRPISSQSVHARLKTPTVRGSP
jgi:hypothetical protein